MRLPSCQARSIRRNHVKSKHQHLMELVPSYKCRFKERTHLNGWNREQKGEYLAISILRQAQGVLEDMKDGAYEPQKLYPGTVVHKCCPPEILSCLIAEHILQKTGSLIVRNVGIIA
ncbi:hypothetical protein CHS0354_015650 [Potamilus streckersoni]|uniref:Uncharacterized protein n=1 Tax=Potamilus streckersoni TaxID=2493646 RepID=A0AAE0SFG4_9BIVA|nr:hypothetical protein CHS0354_015650 [Potamilus streckersoni]